MTTTYTISPSRVLHDRLKKLSVEYNNALVGVEEPRHSIMHFARRHGIASSGFYFRPTRPLYRSKRNPAYCCVTVMRRTVVPFRCCVVPKGRVIMAELAPEGPKWKLTLFMDDTIA